MTRRSRPVWARAPLLLPLLLIALALGLVPVRCTRTPRPEVHAVAARRAPLRVEVATNGTVEPIDDVEVRARLDGLILEIPDDAGQTVQAGQEIVRFDSAPVAGELAAAGAERLGALESLRAARAAAQQARKRAQIDTELYEQKALTRHAYDTSVAALREAEAQLAFQEREVPLRIAGLDLRIDELEAQRAAATVRAPFDGTVYKVQAKRGQRVPVGQPLLWLSDLGKLRVRANVDQVDLGRVQNGQRVVVSANAFPGRSWSGVISELIPNVFVKESRSVSEGLANIDPPTAGLVPGMTVDVDIIVAEAPNALQVPPEAIFYRDGQAIVYQVQDDRVRAVPVKLGLSSITATEIAGGLEDDATVVVGPVPGLEDGMRVVVRQPDAVQS